MKRYNKHRIHVLDDELTVVRMLASKAIKDERRRVIASVDNKLYEMKIRSKITPEQYKELLGAFGLVDIFE